MYVYRSFYVCLYSIFVYLHISYIYIDYIYYVYIYVLYIYAYIYTHIYTYIFIHIYIYIYIYINIYSHTYLFLYPFTFIRSLIYIYVTYYIYIYTLTGRIYVAKEGVNAQMAVPSNILKNFKDCCETISLLEGLYLNTDHTMTKVSYIATYMYVWTCTYAYISN
jgi:hypothetical protein